MTTFYFIRHGDNDLVGHTLAGRKPGVHLNGSGRQQAERLAQRLAAEKITAIFSSPLERARETAEPIARELRLPLRISEAFNEVEFGDWTGCKVAELEGQEKWKQWNTFRSAGRIPNGESMLEVQARVVGELERLRREFADRSVAIVSHADPIRAALVYYLGMPLDLLQRLEISPASITVLCIDDWSAKLLGLNEKP